MFRTIDAAAVGALLAALALPSAAGAGPCDLLNRGAAEAVVKVGGRTEAVPPGGWRPLQECSALEVVKGPVQVRGLVGGVPQKVTCETGPCALPPGSRSLAVSSTSSYRLVPGGHRMDEDVARRSGVPFGEVCRPEAAARFDLSGAAASGGGAATFTLRDAGSKAVVYETSAAGGAVQVPVDRLARGKRYAWELARAGARVASGGFQLASAADAAEVERELAALSAVAGRGPAEKLLDELSVYLAHDLEYEAAALREALRSLR